MTMCAPSSAAWISVRCSVPKTLPGVVSIDSLKVALKANLPLESALLELPAPVLADMPLSELISHVAAAPYAVPVVNEDNNYIGIISKAMLLRALDKEGGNE